jgi:hypothetical protein
MSSLIDEDTGAWDTDVARGFFDESIASIILQIPLSGNRGDDSPPGSCQVWHIYG